MTSTRATSPAPRTPPTAETRTDTSPRCATGGRLAARTTLQVQVWGQLANSTVFLTIPEAGVLDQTAERDDRSALGMQAEVNRATDAGEFTVGMSGRADWTTYTLDRTEERVPLRASSGERRAATRRSGSSPAGAGSWATVCSTTSGSGPTRSATRASTCSTRCAAWQEATDPMLSPKVGARYILTDRIVAARVARAGIPWSGRRDRRSEPAAGNRLGRRTRCPVRRRAPAARVCRSSSSTWRTSGSGIRSRWTCSPRGPVAGVAPR